jgi:hypothetical protein
MPTQTRADILATGNALLVGMGIAVELYLLLGAGTEAVDKEKPSTSPVKALKERDVYSGSKDLASRRDAGDGLWEEKEKYS